MDIGKEKGVQVKVVDTSGPGLEPKLNTFLRVNDNGASLIDGSDVMIVAIEPTDKYVYIYYVRVGVAVG